MSVPLSICEHEWRLTPDLGLMIGGSVSLQRKKALAGMQGGSSEALTSVGSMKTGKQELDGVRDTAATGLGWDE